MFCAGRYAFVDRYRPRETPILNVFWANQPTGEVKEQGTH